MSEEVAIKLENLTKEYSIYPNPSSRLAEFFSRRPLHETRVALDKVSLEVPAGQTVGVIGANGAGKSTLLRILAGIIDPTGGSYRIVGRVAPLLELGAGFVPLMNAIDNIRLNGKLLGLSGDEIRELTPKILEFAGLEDYAEYPLRTYSAGMQLRLGFAIAQSLEPDVILIDEVLAVGDAAFQKKCLSRIEEFRRKGSTILIVTHSMADLGGLCNRVIRLERGRVAAEGPTEEVVRAYLEDMKASSRAEAPPWRVQNPHRRTTSEIVIDAVEILGPGGKKADSVKTGDSLCLRICYRVNKPVENPLFRVQIFRSDGLFVHGTNTYRHGLRVGRLEKNGVVELNYERLNLLEGRYWFNVGVYPDEYGRAVAEHAYDLLEPAFQLDVAGDRKDGDGVMTMPHKWEIAG